MVDLATKMLLHDKTRFAITVAGVAFAVTLVFVQMGLFFGLLDNASTTIDHLKADLWITSKNNPNIDFPQLFPENRVQRVRSVPGVEYADNLILIWMDVSLPTGAKESTLVYALEDFVRWNLPWKLMEGNPDDLRRGRYVIFDDSAKKRFGPFSVGDHRELLSNRLKIIGRSKEALSFTTAPISFMNYKVAQTIIGGHLLGRTTYVLVKVTPGADIETVRRALKERLPFNDVLTRNEWSAKSRAYWVSNTGLGASMFLTVFLGTLVGVVIVAQTLYTSTMEHLREFGTVKAIGGTNRDIYRIIGKQALIAALVGFVVGVIPSFLMRQIVERSTDLKILVPPLTFAIIFVGTIVMCLSASVISFRKIASLEPAMVFRN